MDDDDDDDAYSNLAEGLENGWSAVVLTGSLMLDQNVDEIRIIPGIRFVEFHNVKLLKTRIVFKEHRHCEF